MLRPLKDAFLVKVHKKKHDTISIGGKELFLDVDFNRYGHAVQYGIVASVPMRISHRYENEHGHTIGFYGHQINTGDKIYFHHFVTEPENTYNIEGQELHLCQYAQTYCVIRDGEIEMIEDWLLAELVMEDESNLRSASGIYLKPELEKIPGIAVIRHLSKVCKEQGMREGDTIVYKKDADYMMEVEGKNYYRMKAWNVAVIIRDGKLVPVRDTIVIKEHPQQNDVVAGIEIVALKKKKQQYATVLSLGEQVEPFNFDLNEKEFKQFGIGDTVVYHNGTAGYVEHEKQTYGIIESGNILGFINGNS